MNFWHFTWVHLLCSKSDVISIFSNFDKLIQTQFGVNINFFCNDNAPELSFSDNFFFGIREYFLFILMLIRLNRILWLNESINIFLMLHVYSCFSLAFHWTIGVIVFSLPHISLIVFHIWFCLVKLLLRFFIIRLPLILIYVLLVVCVMVQLLINITLSFLLEPFSLFFLVIRLVIRDINC